MLTEQEKENFCRKLLDLKFILATKLAQNGLSLSQKNELMRMLRNAYVESSEIGCKLELPSKLESEICKTLTPPICSDYVFYVQLLRKVSNTFAPFG